MKHKYIVAVWIIAAVTLAMFFAPSSMVVSDSVQEISEPPVAPASGYYHAHADFKVFINGNELDFSKAKYDEKDSFIHLHITNPAGGYVLHLHHPEATLGRFFSSLGMAFNSTCFATESTEYCGDEERTKLYVNGEEREERGNYAPKDMDRILVTYGNGDVVEQTASVPDVACAFSGACVVPPELQGYNLA